MVILKILTYINLHTFEIKMLINIVWLVTAITIIYILNKNKNIIVFVEILIANF